MLMKTEQEKNRDLLGKIAILSTIGFGLFMLLPFIAQYLPVNIVMAEGSNFVTKLVKWVGGTAGGIVAILLMISIVRDVAGLVTGKGQTSPIKIVGKVLFLILCIGLIYLALKYDTLGKTASDLGQKAIDKIDSDAQDILK